MHNKLNLAISCLFMAGVVAQAQIPPTPLEVGGFKKTSSHETMVQYLQTLTAASSRLTMEMIGTTVQGRVIPKVRVDPLASGTPIKVLIFCQQHGNEPSGKEAALMLLARIAAGVEDSILTHLELTIVPSVNPDGNEAGKRANANGEDLNRDHLLLTQPEVLAVHRLYERLQPEVTLDVHEYSAYRKEFREAGYVRAVDEQLGAPTNLNVSPAIRAYAQELYPFLEERLGRQSITFANYLKMNAPDDTVRPSTTSIDDGRQSLAIMNRFSFILEGKNGRGMDDELKRRTMSQLATIEGFLAFVNMHHDQIRSLVDSESGKISTSKDSVIMAMEYLYKGEKVDLPVLSLRTGKDSTASFMIAPEVTSLASVVRPHAYVIPRGHPQLVEFLRRHNVSCTTATRSHQRSVERYAIMDVRRSWMENKPTWVITTKSEQVDITIQAGDVIVPLSQLRGTMLAIALEPSSMWGLAQRDPFAFLRAKGTTYPIYRIIAEGSVTE